MKRLTWKRSVDGYTDVGLRKGVTAYEAICKLADYEEAEAEAKVDAVELPCKVGDTVWIVGDKFPAEIECIIIDEDGISFQYAEYDRGYEETELWDEGRFRPKDIGKTVFLTPEEAEEALAERRKGE